MKRSAAIVLFLAAACGIEDDAAKSLLGGGCYVNSDCDPGLVCVFRLCHEACQATRDCAIDERCVRGESGHNVCQLGSESRCVLHSDCQAGQVCAVDGRCRDQCLADADCIGGQVCAGGACADREELNEDGELPSEGNGEGSPCTLNSDCPDSLFCIEGRCLYECDRDYDCPSGKCIDHRCVPLDNPNDDCVPGRQESCACPVSGDGVHLCQSDRTWGPCVPCSSGQGGSPGVGGGGSGGTSMGNGGASTSSSTTSTTATGSGGASSSSSTTSTSVTGSGGVGLISTTATTVGTGGVGGLGTAGGTITGG
jgi:hypothetical protein